MDGRIYKLTKSLTEELEHKWTVDEMANVVNLSAPHLHKLFKEKTGTPPMRFLCDLRLEKARELLESTFLQVKQIGFLVCLGDKSNFNREFKRKYGLTPAAYRKNYWDRIQMEEAENNK